MRRLLALSGLAATPLAHALSVVSGASASIDFDKRVLQARGYAPGIADFFARSPRFLPGMQEVVLSVNGQKLETAELRFDNEGRVCFEPALLRRLGLREAPPDTDACQGWLESYPAAQITLHPGIRQVAMLVPEEAFLPAARTDSYLRGGSAVLLNYDLFTRQLSGRGGGHSIDARLQPGMNIDNWVLRGDAYYSWADNWGSSLTHRQWYASRAIESWRALFRFGQLQAGGEAFAGLPFTGIEIASDSEQFDTSDLLVPIQGIARSQALVEVRQRGQLVYRTVVPPGNFVLSQLGRLTGGIDIDIEVTEADGSRQHWTLPAAIGFGDIGETDRFHIGLGVHRTDLPRTDERWRRHAPMLIGEYAFHPFAGGEISLGAMLARHRQHFSQRASYRLAEGTVVYGGLRQSHIDRHSGQHAELGGTWLWSGAWSGSFYASRRTPRYAAAADVADASWLYRQHGYLRDTYSLSLARGGWRRGRASYSVGLYRYSHQRDTVFHGLTYNLAIGGVSIQASLQDRRGTWRDRTVYLSASIPLDRGSMQVRSYRRDGSSSHDIRYAGRSASGMGYSAGVTRDDRSRIDGSLSLPSTYARIGLGASAASRGQFSSYLAASGGLLWSGGRFAAAPYAIGHSFGVLNVPQTRGLQLDTPSGTVITDYRGIAVIPALRAYASSRIAVRGNSVPTGIQLDTAATEWTVARGTVADATIGATVLRQLLLTIRTPNGELAPLGAALFDDEGQMVTSVINGGQAMLVNQDIGKRLTLDLPGGNACLLTYEVPPQFDPEEDYLSGDAECR
ncbi:MAG TPA: fimbria/pilus outer membrane usher protein [Dyella sp.]|uniref:fimbria/pilus outer membrane usher protein n=1 Tax=Dyella sp. TaxID=1869338 RepID=UPI002F91F0A7